LPPILYAQNFSSGRQFDFLRLHPKSKFLSENYDNYTMETILIKRGIVFALSLRGNRGFAYGICYDLPCVWLYDFITTNCCNSPELFGAEHLKFPFILGGDLGEDFACILDFSTNLPFPTRAYYHTQPDFFNDPNITKYFIQASMFEEPIEVHESSVTGLEEEIHIHADNLGDWVEQNRHRFLLKDTPFTEIKYIRPSRTGSKGRNSLSSRENHRFNSYSPVFDSNGVDMQTFYPFILHDCRDTEWNDVRLEFANWEWIHKFLGGDSVSNHYLNGPGIEGLVIATRILHGLDPEPDTMDCNSEGDTCYIHFSDFEEAVRTAAICSEMIKDRAKLLQAIAIADEDRND
jgi:hypothetical protein